MFDWCSGLVAHRNFCDFEHFVSFHVTSLLMKALVIVTFAWFGRAVDAIKVISILIK